MNKERSILVIILAIGTAVLLESCTKIRDAVPVSSDCSTINAKFITDINPIIQSYCAINSGCHSNGSVSGPGPLTNYSQINAVAANIREAVISGRMPLGSVLSSNDLQKIKCWVDSGALNN